MSAVSPKTPCVGLCSTVYGDVICRGCKRFHHEVIGWNGYNDEQKQAVLQRLDRLLAPLIERRFELFDSERLQRQLVQQGIRFCQSQSPYCWVWSLLARKARQINSLADYGLALRPSAQGQTLPELYQAVETEFFALSGAYYQRYLTLSPSPSPAPPPVLRTPPPQAVEGQHSTALRADLSTSGEGGRGAFTWPPRVLVAASRQKLPDAP